MSLQLHEEKLAESKGEMDNSIVTAGDTYQYSHFQY